MSSQQQRFVLIRLKTVAANAYFEQLRIAVELGAMPTGLDDFWAELMTESMPESVGSQLSLCRQTNCTEKQLRKYLSDGKTIAISNFRHAQRQVSSADKPT